MKEINENNCLNLLLDEFPGFHPYLKNYINYWGEETSLMGKMSSFEDYTLEMIRNENHAELKKIFYFIELMICKGDEYVKNMATTGFLENLININPKEVQFGKFSKYLGKQSVAYCEAWDNFCEMKTEGLYYDPISFKYDWEEDFDMELKIENDIVVLKANKAALISLANQLLNLANDQMPVNEKLEYTEKNSLNDGSSTLRIQKNR